MKISRCIVLALAGFALAVSASHAISPKEEKELKGEYLKYMAAVKSKDYKTLNDMMAPDFKMQEGGQTASREQSMAGMKQWMSTVKSIDKWNYHFGKLTGHGNIATGTVYEDLAMTVYGRDHKTHKITEKGWSSTSFRKTKDGWKVINVKDSGTKMTMDGRPFDATAAMSQKRK